MRIAFTILLCSLFYSLHAQSFEDHIQSGDRYYDEEDYVNSAKEYTKAFELKEGNVNQYYNAGCSWALTGDTIQSIKFLILSAEKGWKNLRHIKRDKDLRSLHNVSAWGKILGLVEANKKESEKDYDQELMAQLNDIYIKDQTLRQLYRDAEDKFGRDSEEMRYFWQLVSEQDSINEAKVVQLIEDHGWIGKNVVGGQANMTLWLVIQHAPLPTQEKYLPLLKASVLKGESQGSHLALLEDRIQMRNEKPQTYGSQITVDEVTGEHIVYEIWEPEYVNQRRAEVGLGPIQDYVKRWGIEWTIEQKEKE